MMWLRRRKKVVLAVAGVILIASFGYLVLTRPPRPPDVALLEGKPLVWTGLATTAKRSDVYEPFEILVYRWNEPFEVTRAELQRELGPKGFRVHKETSTYVEWTLEDLDIGLCAARSSSGAHVVLDPNWSTVSVWRLLDSSWLNQLRILFFDSRKA